MHSILRSARSTSLLRARPRVFQPTQLARSLVTKRFTVEHEAVEFDDATGLGVVRITDHAQQSLGDVVFVELPVVGTKVAQGDQIGAVESVKAASDIYAPVSGTITEVNDALSTQPGLLNKSPDDKGWLCKINLTSPDEMEKLLTEEAYNESL
ncbi:Glycine cleavage system H protein [Mycena indigotica]|uniref:Glycine cleavage system H protein n=1 Tax=Mycena indigotica TaxID=2126181 RepID=A0A8H6SW34_9AGAR|nr:Glycine cleavage system H protein [Mycena indigotica]KAF7306988.1 Glycine cleavage system H protein [Mycena indigotica]